MMLNLESTFTTCRQSEIEKQIRDMLDYGTEIFLKYVVTHDVFYALIDRYNDFVMSLGLDPYECVVQAATINNSYELITKLNQRYIIVRCKYSDLKGREQND